MEKYLTKEKMDLASNFLKNCWLKRDKSIFMANVIPIEDGVYFKNTQENILNHMDIVNCNY